MKFHLAQVNIARMKAMLESATMCGFVARLDEINTLADRSAVHPYSETWIVRNGKAQITADGVDIEAGPGDIGVVGPETPHKFKNIDPDRLEDRSKKEL